MIPTILPWLWTVVLLNGIYLIYIFIYNQFWSSDGYKGLGYEEAHDISKKEEPTATNTFSNSREAPRRAVLWVPHDAPRVLTTGFAYW